MTISKLWVSSLALLATVSLPLQAASPVTVGSKIDTEGALLGNMILQVLESHGVKRSIKFSSGRRQSFVARLPPESWISIRNTPVTGRSFLKMKTIRHGKMQSKALRKSKNWMRSRISWSG